MSDIRTTRQQQRVARNIQAKWKAGLVALNDKVRLIFRAIFSAVECKAVLYNTDNTLRVCYTVAKHRSGLHHIKYCNQPKTSRIYLFGLIATKFLTVSFVGQPFKPPMLTLRLLSLRSTSSRIIPSSPRLLPWML